MRPLLAAALIVAALPIALPSASACHMPLAEPPTDDSGPEAIDPFDTPDEPHNRPADFHWHECGDGHAWLCAHTNQIDDCVRTW